MNCRTAIGRVKNMYKMLSSDINIADRTILIELKSTANQEIKRQIDKRKLFASPNIFTEIPCVEMQEASLVECCTYVSDCKVARSKYKLPKIGESVYGLLVQGVRSIDRKVNFLYSTANRYANYTKLANKKQENFFWVFNGYLYISNPEIETVYISAYFEEDVDPLLFFCSEENLPACPENPYDKEFKVPGYLEDAIILQVFNKFNSTFKRSKADNTKDDLDESQ